VLRQPYLRRPPLDQAKIWLCCAPHYCLHSDRRDRPNRPPFKTSDRLKLSGNPPRPVRVAGRFLLDQPLDQPYFLVCCAPLCYLHFDQRDRSYVISPAKSIHLKISGKIPLGTVRAAGLFLFYLPLDQAYFWIYDAPGCDTHSERWRLEINPPATFSTCLTEGRQYQVSFGILEISGDPTVNLC